MRDLRKGATPVLRRTEELASETFRDQIPGLFVPLDIPAQVALKMHIRHRECNGDHHALRPAIGTAAGSQSAVTLAKGSGEGRA